MKARLPQGMGGGGAANLQQLARQAQKMQEQMEQITTELEAKEYTAAAGGGAVSATVTGKMEVKNIDIKPEVIDPDDAEMLGDLVAAAVNEALRAEAWRNLRRHEPSGHPLMAGYHVPPLERLVDKFESLPGVGHKSAQRIAYAVLNMDKADAESFAQAIIDAHEQIHYCSVCCNLTDGDLCPVCRDESRDRSVICVVEDPRDVFALERTNEFHATYHVLHGAISPLGGIGPDQLKIKELLRRVQDGTVQEVIMATNPDTEGEATAMYLARLLRPFGVRVTRLAYGIPVGGHLEFADDATLMRALEGRRDI